MYIPDQRKCRIRFTSSVTYTTYLYQGAIRVYQYEAIRRHAEIPYSPRVGGCKPQFLAQGLLFPLWDLLAIKALEPEIVTPNPKPQIEPSRQIQSLEISCHLASTILVFKVFRFRGQFLIRKVSLWGYMSTQQLKGTFSTTLNSTIKLRFYRAFDLETLKVYV